MSTGHVLTKDNVDIFFKDWGTGQPVVFSHGWPLNADAWDDAMMFVARNGFRGIAHDRRGGGRSSQPWDGNDLDAYADDLWAVIESLDLNDIVLVGHSTGGGEVTRYVGRHGTSRVAKMVLISAIPPFLRKTDKNPDGLPVEVFDTLRDGMAADRGQFYKDLGVMFCKSRRQHRLARRPGPVLATEHERWTRRCVRLRQSDL
jgi:non-heme chloroperoxidase